jgi:hypothetical protein
MRVSLTIARRLTVGVAALAVAAVAAAPAAAAPKDRNHDQIPDRWEAKHGLSLSKNQARKDQDTDGLANRGEFEAGTDPHDSDTDGDGVEDGDEGAGTISSFDATTGVLVINPFAGAPVTGTVTADTEIDCENDDAVQPDDQSDDDQGDDVGDDQGDDVGDDQGHARDSHSGEGDGSCTTADLIPGAIVREASLDVTPTGLVYDEIELH